MILDGLESDGRVTHMLYLLSKFREAHRIRAWLIKNRVTGKRFKTFCQEEEFSPLRILARINKAVVEEFTIRP